jgi:hypothetical protein
MEVVPSVSEFFQWPKFTHTNQHFMVDVTSKGCVTLCVALPFTLKKYLNAKEELWKLKYFTMQKYNLQKIL